MQDTYAQEFPKLQLRILPTLPNDGLHEIQHVFPAHQVQEQTQGSGRRMARNGPSAQLAVYTSADDGTICCEA